MPPSDTPKNLLKQIKQFLAKSDYNSPLPLLKSLLKQQPNSIIAYLYLAFCFLKLGDLSKADIAFGKARELLDEQRQKNTSDDSDVPKMSENEMNTLKAEILKGHLECLLQMEAKDEVADVVLRPKKQAIYTEILNDRLLPVDGSDAKWWRIFVDMYVEAPQEGVSTDDDSNAPYQRDNIDERAEALRKMLQLWDSNESVQKLALDTPLVNRASAQEGSAPVPRLQKHIILENLLTVLLKKEDTDIEKKTEQRVEQFVEEKKEDAFQKMMKKRKCSRGEANMLLHGQVFATEEEKAQEAARYRSQLHKDLVLESQEWDKLFEDYLRTMREARHTVHKALYLRYLKRRYAQFCHKHAPSAPVATDAAEDKATASTIPPTKLTPTVNIDAEFASLVKVCVQMLNLYQVEFYPMKLLLFLKESSQWKDEYLAQLTILTPEVYLQRLRTKILTFYPYKGIAEVLLSSKLIESNYAQNHIEQVETFIQEAVQQHCPLFISAWVPYAHLWYTMDKFKLSAQLARMGLEKIEQRHALEGLTFAQQERNLKEILCDALFESEQLDESENIAKELLRQDKNNVAALKAMARVTLAKGNLQLASKLYERALALDDSDANAHCELGWIYHLQGDNAKSEEHLTAALKLNPKDYLVHHRLGCLYWDMGGDYRTNKEKAYSSFLQSAKLNPRLSSNFTYLGHYYFIIEHDIPRAQKCYQKAVTLNPLEQEAGENLATIYQSKHQDDLAVALFQEATEKNSRAHWAWKRLGFHQQVHGDYDSALKSFQFALRANAQDAMTWEGLAETYHKQGKYLAASKAYSRCFELDKTSVYALSQIGVVSNLLGELNDAYVTFQSVIETDPDFVLGYTGLAEALFDKAKEYYESGILVTSAQHLLGALTALNVFVKKNANFKTVWKMLGDVSCMFFLLSDSIINEANDKMQLESASFVSFPRVVYDNFERFTKRDALALASDAFAHLTKLNPNFADHHFDLGVSYAYQYFSQSAEEMDTKHRNAATESIHEAIRIQPNQWNYWNVLGCIVPDEHLKQHCFIKAIQKNPKTASPWNNLGALYMRHSQFALAQKAFANAQNLSPKDAISWMGLAILSERRLFTTKNGAMNEETLTRAKSAYTFSWSLKNSLAASLGFAYTSFLHKDYQETCHAVIKYLQLDEENPLAWNVFGVSLEALGRFEQARDILSIALEKARGITSATAGDISTQTAQKLTVLVGDASENGKERGANIIFSITMNLVRVLCQLGEFGKASELVKSVGSKSLDFFDARIALESQSSTQAHKTVESVKNQGSAVHLLLALSYVREKKWQHAESSVLEYARQHPSNIHAHTFLSLVQCLNDGGSCTRAIQYLSGVTHAAWEYGTRTPQIQELQLHMAQLLLSREKPDEALTHCHRALMLDPTNHKVLLTMLRSVTHPRYLLSTSSNASRISTIHALCNQAWEPHVGTMLTKCGQNRKDAVDTYVLVGSGLLLVGSTQGDQVMIASRIRIAALHALRIDPSSQRAMLLLIASASVGNGNVIDLIQVYLQEEQTNEMLRVHLLELLCQQYITSEQCEKCVDTVDKHVGSLQSSLQKATLLALKSLAQSVLGLRAYRDTLADALELAGDNADLQLVASMILLREKQFDEASSLLQFSCAKVQDAGVASGNDFALATLKVFTLATLLDSAKGAQKTQLSQDASRLCRALVDSSNMSGLAHFLYGVTKFKEGDLKEAERQLLDAGMREPNLHFVNQYLYEVYYAQERWEESERHLLRETHLRPHDADLVFYLADFAFQSQQKERALEFVDRALVMDPQHEQALHLKKSLEQKEKKQPKQQQAAVRARRR